MSQWIKLADKKPSDKEIVLVFDEYDNLPSIGCYNEKFNTFQEERDWGDFFDYPIQYWMPLPKGPY